MSLFAIPTAQMKPYQVLTLYLEVIGHNVMRVFEIKS